MSQRNKDGGKFVLPDCSHGYSKEFPTYFHHKHQLTSRISIDNPYVEPDFRDKTIQENKKGKFLEKVMQSKNQLPQKQKDENGFNINTKEIMKKENILKNTNRILLRNFDMKTYQESPQKHGNC